MPATTSEAIRPPRFALAGHGAPMIVGADARPDRLPREAHGATLRLHVPPPTEREAQADLFA